MERGQFDNPGGLEHDDPARTDRIQRIAPYLVFEHLMADVDDGKMTQAEAFERMAALRPLVVEGEG